MGGDWPIVGKVEKLEAHASTTSDQVETNQTCNFFKLKILSIGRHSKKLVKGALGLFNVQSH